MIARLIFYAFLAICFSQCTTPDEKKHSTAETIIFETSTAESAELNVAVKTEAEIRTQQLSLSIRLKNTGKENLRVEAVEVETVEGYLAKPIGKDTKFDEIPAGSESSFELGFIPVNDPELFSLTGENGKLRRQYQLTIFYRKTDTNQPGSVKIPVSISAGDYAVYEKNDKQRVSRYKIDTTAFSTTKQEQHLETLFSKPAFLYISYQEIAIAGLNFKLQCHWLDDSVHMKVFIVNHADFEIKIDTALLNIIGCGNDGSSKNSSITFIKTSGTTQHENIMRKGDRVEIRITKYCKTITCEKPNLIFKNAFLLPGNKPLFYADMVFVKI